MARLRCATRAGSQLTVPFSMHWLVAGTTPSAYRPNYQPSRAD
jgi:hypothetical protein